MKMYDCNLFNLHRASYLPSLTLVNLSFSSASIQQRIHWSIYWSTLSLSVLPVYDASRIEFRRLDMFILALRSFGHGVPPACGNRWTSPAQISQAICTFHKIDIEPIHYGFGSQMTQQIDTCTVNKYIYIHIHIYVCDSNKVAKPADVYRTDHRHNLSFLEYGFMNSWIHEFLP